MLSAPQSKPGRGWRRLFHPLSAILAIFHLSIASADERASKASLANGVKITLLSTMLADDGMGEWGFSALIETRSGDVLFDTGARPTTVLENAAELGLDLARVRQVVLSHHHSDHVGGLMELRRKLASDSPLALGKLHVGEGIFHSRPVSEGETNPMLAIAADYRASGGAVTEHSRPAEILPGVFVSGPIPRDTTEENFPARKRLDGAGGLVEDEVPEDMAVFIRTPAGAIVLTGCGHAGIVNTSAFAMKVLGARSVKAVIGGMHLYAAPDRLLGWTAGRLRGFGVGDIIGAHCTGLEAVFRLRQLMGLNRRNCVVGAVGASYSLERGIDPRLIAR